MVKMGLQSFLFPPRPRCLICSREFIFSTLSNLCDSCLEKLSFITRFCLHCGCQLAITNQALTCQLCSKGNFILERIRAPLLYQGLARDMIIALKYQQNTGMALPLAQLMADYWKYSFSNHSADYLLVPVPLSQERRNKRGYNQALLLADIIAEQEKMEVKDLVKRIRNTPSLYALGKTQRKEVLQGAFQIETRAKNIVKNRKILLIDDVVTTGSTLNEVGEKLLAAGAKQVSALTATAAERV